MNAIQEAIEARRRGGSAKDIARQLVEGRGSRARPAVPAPRRSVGMPAWKRALFEELDLLEQEGKVDDKEIEKIKDMVLSIGDRKVAGAKLASVIEKLPPEIQDTIWKLIDEPEPTAPVTPADAAGAEAGADMGFELGDLGDLGAGAPAVPAPVPATEAEEKEKDKKKKSGEGATDGSDEGEKEAESLRHAMSDLVELGEAIRDRCAKYKYERNFAMQKAGLTESALCLDGHCPEGHIYSMTERACVKLTPKRAMLERLVDGMISEEAGPTDALVGPGGGPKIDLGVELEVPNAADPNGGDIINEPEDIDLSADDAALPSMGGGDPIDGGEVAQPIGGSGPAKMPESMSVARMQMNMRTPMLGALIALEEARKKERTDRKHFPSRRDAIRERREILKPRAKQVAAQRSMGNKEMLVDKLVQSGIPQGEARTLAAQIMAHMAENNIDAALMVIRHAPPHLQERVAREVKRLFKIG